MRKYLVRTIIVLVTVVTAGIFQLGLAAEPVTIIIPLIDSSGPRVIQSSKAVIASGEVYLDISTTGLSGGDKEVTSAVYYLDNGTTSRLVGRTEGSSQSGITMDTRLYSNGRYKVIVNAETSSGLYIGIKWLEITTGEEND